ncbi:flavin reductase family protein [Salipaludibacillus aurantiacus]|uniref:NADH-FMN oxidoreductase RutF, flavin reductase (DIM6/NTAB) family n=1 Tax=Salipaludibacillus aurantiacus TaxID=1601833 RepID=A0A1H9WRZ7_9BACI|nr:flavin reductase family protein [Salipaludibacillus aurantiacus]SES36581.1 NADH-FMN oxidoreductase RutF, flavin reductase (DIM6/NTAB) family [Salipaludibacillus aurantiacus]
MLESTPRTVMHCYPGLIALVTAKNDETQNIMAAGWHSYISYDPPIYGVAVAKERFTHHLIKESGNFAINFVPAEYAHFIEASGKKSGSDGDKFTKLMAKWKKGEATGAPILENAYVAYECEVMDINTYGDHDWIVGKITLFHQDKERFEENGLPDFSKLQLPLFLGQSKYLIADKATTMKEIHLDK